MQDDHCFFKLSLHVDQLGYDEYLSTKNYSLFSVVYLAWLTCKMWVNSCNFSDYKLVQASDHDNTSAISSTFATKIGVRNTTNHEPTQSISEAFSVGFWGQRSPVSIHLIDWIDFKRSWRVSKGPDESKTFMRNYEHLYGKYIVKVSIYVKIGLAAAFRYQCEPRKQFADSGSMFNRNMGEYVFCSWFKPFLPAIHHLLSTADLPNVG